MKPELNLFAVIPEKFFSVLASPLKEDYANILFRIFHQYRLTNFGLSREVLLDIIIDYLEEKAEDEQFTRLLDESVWEESLDLGSSPRDRASFVLRKLEETGWITRETLVNYEEYINLTDYAIQILDLLDKIRKNHRAEYQGYVFATYTLLYTEEASRQGALALEKAYEQTDALLNGLKALSHNIKRYIERVQDELDPKAILRLHFEDYKAEILDRSYHRLKTSDNVSRYRPKIVDRINQWYNDENWVQEAAVQEVQRRRQGELTIEEARELIYGRLDFIRQTYLNLDQLLEEIDRRNSQYASASLLQIQYRLNSSQNLEGQILSLLQYLAKLRTEQAARGDDDLPEAMNGLFSLYSQSYLDEKSLYTPRRAARQHQPAEVVEAVTVDERVRTQRVAELQARLAEKLTRDKINRYVLEKLGEREMIRAEELGIEAMEDYLKLIYTAVYGRSQRVDYRVEYSGPRVTAAEGAFEFKNIVIRRRKGR